MMGLPRPVASLHNSWFSQKGGVLAQTLLPGSKKKVQRNRADGDCPPLCRPAPNEGHSVPSPTLWPMVLSHVHLGSGALSRSIWASCKHTYALSVPQFSICRLVSLGHMSGFQQPWQQDLLFSS